MESALLVGESRNAAGDAMELRVFMLTMHTQMVLSESVGFYATIAMLHLGL